MANIDLNARRALREASTVTAGEHTYTLSTHVPASLMTAALSMVNAGQDPTKAAGASREIYLALFGEKQVEAAMRDIGIDELAIILGEA